MSDGEKVSIQWVRPGQGPHQEQAGGARPRLAHPCFRLSADVLVELPPRDWGHGDLLVYLPRQGWLVRRRYVDAWYVDIGGLEDAGGGRYLWTDLYLDVVVNEAGSAHRLLDVDEFGQALRDGLISNRAAASALEGLHRLFECIREGRFPPVGIREAEAFATKFREAHTEA